MSKKIITAAMIVLLLAVVLVSPLGAGCSLFSVQDKSELDLALLEEVWEIIQERYVEPGELDAEALIQGAAKGMVNALDDPHSAYMDPDDYEMFTSGLEGEFEGIGAYAVSYTHLTLPTKLLV